MNPTDDDALQNVHNPLKVMQPGERVVCEIKRHPYGLFGIYGTLALVVIISVTAVVVAPQLAPDLSQQAREVLALSAVILSVLMGLFTYIGAMVYKGNRWIVTTDSITQIQQNSLFNTQTSQLSMANLEDVTVEQNGIMQSMFGFGTLHAESAGQQGKFTFAYCPNPHDYAKKLIAVHEAFIAENPEGMHTSNQALVAGAVFNQSYGQQQQYPQPPNGQLSPQPQPPMQPQTQMQAQPQPPTYNAPQYNPAQPNQPTAPTQHYDPTQPYNYPPQGQQPRG